MSTHNLNLLFKKKSTTTLAYVAEHPLARAIAELATTQMFESENASKWRQQSLAFLHAIATAGDEETPPLYEMEILRFSTESVLLRNAGSSRTEALSAIPRSAALFERVLPRGILKTLWPEWSLTTLSWLLLAHPEEISERLRLAAEQLANQPVRTPQGTIKDPTKRLRTSTIKSQFHSLRRLLGFAVETTQRLAHDLTDEALNDPEILRVINQAPMLMSFKFPESATSNANNFKRDRSGPPVREARSFLEHHRLQAFPKDDLQPKNARLLRRHIAMCLDLTLGWRSGSYKWLLREDYIPNHYYPRTQDHSPALRITIEKKPGVPRVVEIKAIPPEIARRIELLIAYCGITDPKAQLFPNGSEWVKTQYSRSDNPMAPKPEKFLKPDHSPNWSHHTMRHTVHHAIRVFTQPQHEERVRNRLDPTLEHASVLVMEAALTGHSVTSIDPHGYYDLSNPQRQEDLARIAAYGNWEYFTTDAGARRVPDWDQYDEIDTQISRLGEQIALIDEARTTSPLEEETA
jgi:hypothetical protein